MRTDRSRRRPLGGVVPVLVLLLALLGASAPPARAADRAADPVPTEPAPPPDARDADGVVALTDGPSTASEARAARAGDTVYVAYLDNGQVAVRPVDGGTSPRAVVHPTSPENGRALEVHVAASEDDVWVVWDTIGSGTVGSFSEVWLATSHDRGTTFESTRLSRNGWQPRIDGDAPWVGVTWVGGGAAFGAVSRDRGETFDVARLGDTNRTNTHDVAVTRGGATVAFFDSARRQVVRASWYGGWEPSVDVSALPRDVDAVTGLRVASDHDLGLAIVWAARPGYDTPIVRIESTRDNGTSWGRKVFNDVDMLLRGFPDVAVLDGEVHAVWRGTSALFEVFSTDRSGTNYGTRVVTEGGAFPYQPRLALSPHGVAVTWYAGDQTDGRIHGFAATRRVGTPTWWVREVPSPTSGHGVGHAYDLVPTRQAGTGWGVVWTRISGPEGVFGDRDVVYRPSSFGPEDLEVLSARLVQGPLDGVRLVADREAKIHVRVRSTFDVRQRVTVRTVQTDADGRETTEEETGVAVDPGTHDLFFSGHRDLAVGTAGVRVELDPRDLVREASELNNDARDVRPVVRTTAPRADVAVLAATPAFKAVNYGAAYTVRSSMTTSGTLLPISRRSGITLTPFRPDLLTLWNAPGGVSHTWPILRELALLKPLYSPFSDIWVVVVPQGFFARHTIDAPKARAVAAAGARLGVVMVEENATSGSAVAHEIAHDVGWVVPDESDAASPYHLSGVSGAGWSPRDERLVREPDFMHPVDGDANRLTRWVSAQSWEGLIDLLAAQDGAAQLSATAADEEHLVVAGSVEADGSVALGPVQPAPGAARTGEGGDVRVRLLDAAGAVLAETSVPSGATADADTQDGRAFVAELPARAGGSQVEVVRGASRTVVEESAPPTVSVLAPTTAVTVDADTAVPVSLAVSDPDGDTVETRVEVDAGSGWVGAALVRDGKAELVPDRRLIGRTLKARVVATDGFSRTVVALPDVVVRPRRDLGDLLVDKNDTAPELEPVWSGDLDALPVAGGAARTLVTAQGGDRLLTPATSPDGRTSWSTLREGDLVVAGPDGEQPRTLVAGTGVTDTLCGRWSPDGRSLAFYRHGPGLPADQRGLWVADVASGSLRKLAGSEALHQYCSLGWADGSVHYRAASSSTDPTAVVWRVDPDGTGRRIAYRPPTGSTVQVLTASRDGRQLAVAELTAASGRSFTRVLVLAAGGGAAREVVAAAPKLSHTALSFGPTGEDLALLVEDFTRSYRNRVDVLDLGSGALRTAVHASPEDGKRWGSLFWRSLPEPPAGPRVVADAGGPYAAVEGSDVVLTGTGRADAGGLQLSWDTDGDGQVDTSGPSATVHVTDEGETRVRLVATDALGQTATSDAVVRVANVAPVVESERAVTDGGSVAVSALLRDPGADRLAARAYWADGSTSPAQLVPEGDGYRLTAQHEGAVEGDVALVVDDGTDETVVTVAPQVRSGSAPVMTDRTVTVGVGHAVTLGDLAVDPDGDVVTLTATGGAGTTTVDQGLGLSGGPRLTHVAPATEGAYDVALLAEDAGGRRTTATLHVVVVAAGSSDRPTVDAGPGARVDEGASVTVTGTSQGASRVRWSVEPAAGCSLGTPSSLSTTVTCTDDGRRVLRLAALDAQGSVLAEDTAALDVVGVAPVVTVQLPGSTPAGTIVELVATSTDPGADTVTCSVAWGDGTSSTGCRAQHAWSTAGTYTVAVTATDDDGLSGTARATVTVTAAPSTWPVSGWYAPVADPPAVNDVKSGSAVPLKFSLGGDRGRQVFASGYPASQSVPCKGSGAPGVLTAASPGPGGLTYDPVLGRYTWEWKTDSRWAGTCRTLVVRFADGTERQAAFRFK